MAIDNNGLTWFPWPGQSKPDWDSLSSQTKVDIGALSHKGKVQPNNEDFFLVMLFTRSMHSLLTNLPTGQIPDHYSERGYVMLVADGIGGRIAGEVASQIAVSTLVDLFIQTPDWIMRPDGSKIMEVLRRMEDRFVQLPDALQKRAQAEPHLHGMGTTLTLAVSLGSELVIAHVGASRVYLFRRGQLLRLTSDQTVAQMLADTGIIRPEDVPNHPGRRALTSSITSADEMIKVELQHMKLIDGDKLLLCSDGLTEMIPEEEISAALEKRKSASHICRALIEQALDAGGTDNVTVVLGCYQIPEEQIPDE
jgi:serine/threonine protein phosphatase PrpC